MSPRSDTSRLLAFLGLGALVFTAGLVLAHQWLPEWRMGGLPPAKSFAARYRAITAGLSMRPAPGEPKISLAAGSRLADDLCASTDTDRSAFAPLCTETRVTAKQRGALPGERRARTLEVRFTPSGEVRSLLWVVSLTEMFTASRASSRRAPEEPFTRAFLQGTERLDAPRELIFGGALLRAYGVLGVPGAGPPWHLLVVDTPQGFVVAHLPGTPDRTVRLIESSNILLPSVLSNIGALLRVLAAGVLFLVLLGRRRIDLGNGAIVGLVVLAASAPAAVSDPSSAASTGIALLYVVWRALLAFLTWSAGESLLRAADPSFTTSLDVLRAGRLGPRGGRALLTGMALGGALAGLGLALHAAAASLPGLRPVTASLRLPVFSFDHDPFGAGIDLAAGLVLLLAIARRFVPPRWAPPLVILAGAALFGPLQLRPYIFGLAANAALAAPLVLLGRRAGLTALLTAAVSSFLLPIAVFSGLHLNWLPGTFAATAGPLAGILVVGLVGLARPAQVEAERLRAPAFMRRIEEERRIKYEMNLLARMQEGLLPEHLPELPGWEVAARSILATEAGGDLYDFLVDDDGWLWVAAGDVAGHGYSCAIVQAMTTAALASLISPKKTPAEVLRQIDRVIRRGGTARNFITLVLLRLDPRTGEVLLSNAGHPYPFLVTPGEVTGVSELDLPGLPLGQGPAREYRNHLFQLPPGGALVICSDGLIESRNWREEPYGFDRPRDVLLGAAHASAGGILDILLADWRRHLGREELPDDTTVVVVKRTGGVAPGAIPS